MVLPLTGLSERIDSQARATAVGGAVLGGRSHQQDTYRIEELDDGRSWLCVLADGMGGHAAGDVASKLAANTFVESFCRLKRKASSTKETFLEALAQANESLAIAQRKEPEISGMGSTLSCLLLTQDGIAWISVGDSPIWLWRKGQLERLNDDHSLRGIAERNLSTSKNMLRSALTGDPIPLIDSHPEFKPLRKDDMIVMASDGLLTLSEDQIAKLIADHSDAEASQLVDMLLGSVQDVQKARQDNCTVIVIKPRNLNFEKVKTLPLTIALLIFLVSGVLLYYFYNFH